MSIECPPGARRLVGAADINRDDSSRPTEEPSRRKPALRGPENDVLDGVNAASVSVVAVRIAERVDQIGESIGRDYSKSLMSADGDDPPRKCLRLADASQVFQRAHPHCLHDVVCIVAGKPVPAHHGINQGGEATDQRCPRTLIPVSYTHLTLPT